MNEAALAAPVAGDELHWKAYGWTSPAQWFAPTFMRHMYEHGTTAEQAAMVKVAHSEHASCNPKALYKNRVTVDDVLARIDSVTLDDVAAVSADLLTVRPTLAVVGPFDEDRDFSPAVA